MKSFKIPGLWMEVKGTLGHKQPGSHWPVAELLWYMEG